MIDVLTVGNGILDAFLTIQDAHEHCRFNHETSELCIKAGEKILLDGCEFQLGGNACNVAVGLSRLGFQVGLMAELADDEFSEKIINGLKKERVDLSFVQRKHGQSSFSIGLNFQGERTLFVEHRDREHIFTFAPVSTKWIYLTSLGNTWEHVYQAVADFKTHSSVKLACNPGSVQLAAGVETFSYLFPLIDILFLSKSEAQRIVGEHEESEDLLRAVQAMGSKVVCLTDGKNGAFAIDDKGAIFHQAVVPANVVEVTGAGDSFAAGFLGAVLSGRTLQESMLWGVTNAASVIAGVGSQPGLLTREAMEQQTRGERNT